MAQIPSPNKDKKATLVDKESGKAFYGTTRDQLITKYEPKYDLRGNIKGLETVNEIVEVPLDGETIDLVTGESDSKYWQPEVVLSPDGCNHTFNLVDVNKREIECESCGWLTEFHPAINIYEENGKAYFLIKDVLYPINIPISGANNLVN